jgi:hypothetical protein
MAAGTWIYDKGSPTGGTGGPGGGGSLAAAPDVILDPPAEVIFRSDHQVEVDVAWAAAATATAQNFLGAAIYLEDPDISSGANGAMDGSSVALDGSAQMSGSWSPVFVNDSIEDPTTSRGEAVLMLDSTMGSIPGTTYQKARDVRIYLAAYGPNTQPRLVRATEANPTPNIMVNIPLGRGQGESGQEWAFLVSNPTVTVTTDYNRTDPQYYLTFTYTPPDPTIPPPPGMNRFGGVRIIFVYEDSSGNPIFPGTDTGITVPVAQSTNGVKSPAYHPGAGGGQFRCYFCSEDDSQPLGHHINSLVEGTTPYAEAIVPAVPGAPDVTQFTISNQKTIHLIDRSMYAEATFGWSLPAASTGGVRYAGVFLYLVSVTGTAPLSKFPQALTAMQSNVDVALVLDIPNGLGAVIPANPEVWTIAAISADMNGVLADDPTKFGQASFHSPTVTWTVGPPAPGSPGSGQEYAPFVTLGSGAAAAATQTLSADGVGMVSFSVGPWTNPTDNKFAGVEVAMVVAGDTSKPTFWPVPLNATSFVTPTMPTFGNFGASVPVDFYLVSDDALGRKNSIVDGTTPKIGSTYLPAEGAIIPARSGWFNEDQFSWTDNGMTADNISAQVVQVGKTLVVGGSPLASFGGSVNGQIAVLNSAGTLRAWMGEQQPGQGNSAPLYGGWFGQLWVGGTSPLDAPLWIDNQAILQLGGIAAAQKTSYPYISVRDEHGYEMGRIGAALNVPSGSLGDGVGPSPPPQLTAGAWFTQLGIGGNNISNWNILIVPDTNNPLGSQFLMRNIHQLQINYPAAPGPPSNAQYNLEFGNNVWMAGGLVGGQWQFPGIHIYEVDNVGNNFGATFLNRGMVLRGSQQVPGYTPYPVLVSLVTFNGNSNGADAPSNNGFWGDFAMFSPLPPYNRTVYLASGNSGTAGGNPQFILQDTSGNIQFEVDTSGNVYIKGVLKGASIGGTDQPVNALAYNVNGYGPVIDATGTWKGKPIASGASQSPWTGPINGAGFPLSNAGNISGSQFYVNSQASYPVINPNGQFVGTGIDVATTQPTAYGIRCGSLTVAGSPSQGNPGGPISCGSLTAQQAVNCTSVQISGNTVIDSSRQVFGYQVYANTALAINSNNQFVGFGVDVGNYGVGCGGVTCRGNMDVSGSTTFHNAVTINANMQANSANIIGNFSANTVNLSFLQVNGNTLINNNYIWQGGVQCTNPSYGQIFGTVFGVSNIGVGWPQGGTGAGSGQPQGAYASFATADGRHVKVCGGLIIDVTP